MRPVLSPLRVSLATNGLQHNSCSGCLHTRICLLHPRLPTPQRSRCGQIRAKRLWNYLFTYYRWIRAKGAGISPSKRRFEPRCHPYGSSDAGCVLEISYFLIPPVYWCREIQPTEISREQGQNSSFCWWIRNQLAQQVSDTSIRQIRQVLRQHNQFQQITSNLHLTPTTDAIKYTKSGEPQQLQCRRIHTKWHKKHIIVPTFHFVGVVNN